MNSLDLPFGEYSIDRCFSVCHYKAGTADILDREKIEHVFTAPKQTTPIETSSNSLAQLLINQILGEVVVLANVYGFKLCTSEPFTLEINL